MKCCSLTIHQVQGKEQFFVGGYCGAERRPGWHDGFTAHIAISVKGQV